jgi:hypothetical protein
MKENSLHTQDVVFELKIKPPFYSKVWREIYLLLFFNIGLILGSVTFFSKHLIIIEICILALLVFKLVSKRSRHIYKVTLVLKEKKLLLHYYQYVFFCFVQPIYFKELSLAYRHKVFGRGKIPKTLEFYKQKHFTAEIREKFNLGWQVYEINEIYNLCKNYCTNENHD